MIAGCTSWQKTGLLTPKVVSEATENYLAEEDAIAAWIADRCERDPKAWTNSTQLFSSWKEWADAAGEFAGSMKRFSQNLENRPGLQRQRDRSDGAGFVGIRLRGYL